jgi:hypothetical protein
MVTLVSVKAGDTLAGIGYPASLLGMAFVIGYFFLPETRNTPLED